MVLTPVPTSFDTPCSECGWHCPCPHRSAEDYAEELKNRPLCIHCVHLDAGDPENARCKHPNNVTFRTSPVTGKPVVIFSESPRAMDQRTQYHGCGKIGRWFEAFPSPVDLNKDTPMRNIFKWMYPLGALNGLRRMWSGND